MWKNASGAQKRKRQKEKQLAKEASKCQKLDLMFGKRLANSQFMQKRTVKWSLEAILY